MTVAIDSSSIIAILNEEPEAHQFRAVINGHDRVIGFPTVLEIRIWVTRRRKDRSREWFESFLTSDRTIALAFDDEMERLAGKAFAQFGKGQHPAALNFGDCMTYAVARRRSLPLLFKGEDFSKTDLALHPASAYSGKKSGTDR